MSKNVIVIGGPTASGKSSLAIDLALEIGGVIINADASQVYRGIPVISAAPTAEDKLLADHRLYEYLDAAVNGNVVMWLEDAVKTIRQVWKEEKTPIVVGGGGLYLDNLINGTTPIPEIRAEVRREVIELLKAHDTGFVYDKLKSVDPQGAEMVNPNDTTRVRRAYEIFLSSGKSIADWFKQSMVKKLPEADFLTVLLFPEKNVIDERCDIRFDKMISDGAIDEVKYLLSRNLDPKLPAMKAQGVPEISQAIYGNISLNEAIDLSKVHTHQYAKRQLTWFRNKMRADMVLNECYNRQIDFLNDVKKQYK